ncbi:MAG TPA: DUF2206 domain-containing protein [Candidatus Saccharimonadales bacterium]|nr:DUF2206 domain-containing protein [Candidatus Saccharimonadales bacterium]
MKKPILFISALLLVVANICTLAAFNGATIAVLVWLAVLVPLSGYLLLTLLPLRKQIHPIEVITFAISLGLLATLGVAVLLNTIGMVVRHDVFAGHLPLLLYDSFFVALLVAAAHRPRLMVAKASWGMRRKTQLLTLAPAVFPLLAAMGAFNLNNGGSGMFATVVVAGIIAYAAAILWFKKYANQFTYISYLFFATVALVLGVSLRSNYLIGFDINQEYQMFQATLSQGYWTPGLLDSAYNACLSITLLPAFLQALIPVAPEYLFKFVLQAALWMLPLLVFAIARRLLRGNSRHAFVAALFFIMQAQFIIQFPALIRQQIALVFFGALFLTLLSDVFTANTKKVLLFIFGLALIVSHYSTAYIALVLLVLIIALQVPYARLLQRTGAITSGNAFYRLGVPLVVALLCSSFLWNSQITATSGNLSERVWKSLTSVNTILDANSRSEFVNTTFGIQEPQRGAETLQQLSQEKPAQQQYAAAADQSTELRSSVAPAITNRSQDVIFALFNTYIPALVKLLAVVGVLYLLFLSLRGSISPNYGIWAVTGGIVFAALVILPSISADYNLERLYQQLLIILSPAIVGIVLLVRGKAGLLRFTPHALVAVLVLYFAATSGLANKVAFDVSSVNVSQVGAYNDRYYVKDAEVEALQWIEAETPDRTPVNFDRYTTLRAEAYTSPQSFQRYQGVLPTQIAPNHYVFAGDANINKGLAFDYYQNQNISYAFPRTFLQEQKNTIYTNGSSEIYK